MDKKYNKFLVFAVLLLIFVLAVFFRVFFDYKTVFSDPIKYSADDGVYHMRLVENELLGGHFPWRINFDPFTNFPYGTYEYWAPLFDWMLVAIIWIISLGHPTLKLINQIAPFYPVVIGSLVVFLVYLIAKKIWSNAVAIFSAFLIAIMPIFLFRSLLGATDHHVAEVFFSTLTMLFLIYLVAGRKGNNLKENIKDKKFWLFTILTGISLGLYFLTWPGALLFLFIIFCFVVFYYLIKYLLGDNEEWILLAGAIIFSIAFLMITPFFGNPDFLTGKVYNISHFLCFISGIFIFLIMGLAGYYFNKKNKKSYFLPLFLFVGVIISAIVFKILFPFLWDTIIKTALEVNYGATISRFARQATSEMTPLRIRGAFGDFSALFFLSLVSFCIFIYKFIKERKPEYFLIIVWTSIILFVSGIIPAFGQNRNSYYLSVCIALLSAFLIVEGFKFGWLALRKADEFAKGSELRFYYYVSSAIIIFSIIFLALYPFPFNIDNIYPSSLPNLVQSVIGMAKSPILLSQDWYDTLKWLRNNTPDPGIDYYALYKAPPIDKKTDKVEPYNYPPQAYGILAEWGVGHDITYYSHRIPIANPFQQGVGQINSDGSVEPGEGTFFLATDEKKAAGYLDQLRAKYVIIDSSLSDPNGEFRGYISWINGNLNDYTSDNLSSTEPTKFDLAMSTRLYFLDGSSASMPKTVNGEKINLVIPSLSHFRLLYESKSDKSILLENDYKTTKQVKVFEYVKGALIKGFAPSGTNVEISTNVATNQNREFIYQQSAEAKDGSFEFVVPYSIGKQENSDTSASEYTIKIGNYTKTIKVSEDDISKGKVINAQ